MKKNGFTMIELLAVIVIIGILSTVVIISVSRYLNNANNTAYTSMMDTIYEGSQNYIMDNIDLLEENKINITTDDLSAYIDELVNPKNKSTKCSANITITNTNNNEQLSMNELTYEITLKCGNTEKKKIYKSGDK